MRTPLTVSADALVVGRPKAHLGTMQDDDQHGPGGSRVHGRGRNFAGTWPATPGRLAGTALIRLYQLTLSGFIGNHCRHLPTCSEYGYEAIARHGLWPGGWLALFRVLRCGPGGTHGFDPVPERLGPGLARLAPWRLWQAGRSRAG